MQAQPIARRRYIQLILPGHFLNFLTMADIQSCLPRRWLMAVSIVAIALPTMLTSGCDSQRIAEIEEGMATEADVRLRFGEPEKVWDASDMATVYPAGSVQAEPGARTLEFNRQPAGTVNYMITIGPDGRVSALRQVLTPQNFAKVQPGMPMETVRKLLGKPMKVTRYDLSRETHYDWRYINPPQQTMVFTAVFNTDLRVVRTGSVDIEAAGEPQRNR